MRTGGSVSYIAQSQTPDEVRSQLHSLGVAVEELEQKDRLWITDLYAASVGRKSKEKFAPESLKVDDMSLWIAQEAMAGRTSNLKQPSTASLISSLTRQATPLRI